MSYIDKDVLIILGVVLLFIISWKINTRLDAKFWRNMWQEELQSHNRLHRVHAKQSLEIIELRNLKYRFKRLIEDTKRKKK